MPDEALVMNVQGRELIVPMPKKTSRLAVPKTPNRAERRQMARAQGQRGAKAKRQKVGVVAAPVESEADRAAREKHESDMKVVESAQSLRQLTGGRMWLPGDKT